MNKSKGEEDEQVGNGEHVLIESIMADTDVATRFMSFSKTFVDEDLLSGNHSRHHLLIGSIGHSIQDGV